VIDIETRLRADADVWRRQTRDDYPELDRLLPATRHRPRRRIARTVAVAAAVLAVAATAAAAVALSRDGDPPAPAGSISAVVPKPIYLDSGLIFQPLPTVPIGALTADEALAAHAAHQRHAVHRLPRGARARYGVLRRPSGKMHRVWAYSTRPLGCPIAGLVPPSPWPQCVDWEFLDAFTGRLVAVRQQQL
jgi:hypothetical protein